MSEGERREKGESDGCCRSVSVVSILILPPEIPSVSTLINIIKGCDALRCVMHEGEDDRRRRRWRRRNHASPQWNGMERGEREGEATAYVQRNDFIFLIFNATAFALSRMERPCRAAGSRFRGLSCGRALTSSQSNAVTLTRTEVPRGKCPKVFCLEHTVVNKSKRGHARKCTRKSVFSTHGKLGEREPPTCRAAC